MAQPERMEELVFHGANVASKKIRDGIDLDKGIPPCSTFLRAHLR